MANLGFGDNPFLGQKNPYLEQQISDAQGDTVRSYNNTVQPAFNSAMVRSGSFGNSGVDQMNQESQRQLQTSLGRQANDFRAQDYGNQQNMYQWDQGFNRQLYNDQYGQNQQNIQTTLGLLGQQNQFNQQDLANGTQIQNTPLNYYQGFANQANGIGQGYGTSTGTSSAQGSPLMGALGGYQLGSQFGKNLGFGGGGWGTGNAFGNQDYGQYF
jgi:hypothetical protein